MFETVFVTVPDEGTAERIAEDSITKWLAACANFFPTRSMYSWKGNFEKG